MNRTHFLKASKKMLSASIALACSSFSISIFALDVTYDDSATLQNEPNGFVPAGSAFIYAGSPYAPANSGNTITINYSSNANPIWIFGGYQDDINGAQASNNVIHFTQGTMQATGVGGIFGGYAKSAAGSTSATNNHIIISGGDLTNITGGFAQTDIDGTNFTVEASNNTVEINGGNIDGNVWGGAVFSEPLNQAIVENNTIIIRGNPVFSSSSQLFGGECFGGPASCIVNNNSIQIHSASVEVDTVKGFQNYDFYLPANVADGAIILKTDTANIGNATVEVKAVEAGSLLKSGDKITLIGANTLNGTPTLVDGQFSQGVSLIYNVDIEQEGNNITATILTISTNPQMKALLEGRIASLGFINTGADLISNQLINSAVKSAVDQVGDGAIAFAAMEGSSQRLKSGSHVDVDGFNMSVGGGYKFNSLIIGGFIEGGWGNYDSHNSFANTLSVDGDGDTSYYGMGLLAHYDIGNGFYVDGSLRTGKVKNEFSSANLRSASGSFASYNIKSTYYGAHTGLGYIWEISPKTQLDLSAKYIWTHINSNNIYVTGDPVYFDSANSHRLRLMGQADYKIDTQFSLLVGAGFEYEFDGKTQGNAYRLFSIDAPSLRGGTGLAELGFRYKPSNMKRLSFEMNLQGSFGKREGVGGQVQVGYSF